MTAKPPTIVVRADASSDIGTGHVMRCLTLAGALQRNGARVEFVSRELAGHLFETIERAGCLVHRLPAVAEASEDARTTAQILAARGGADWLIVDHYRLDTGWEKQQRAGATHIMAIDDLADRTHDCDLLLDQNIYEDADARYLGKLPVGCRTLLGPKYALLRPEFAQLRKSARPRAGAVQRILVFFGGVDAKNYTGCAIDALSRLKLADIQVDVVIGGGHPARAQIETSCRAQGFACHVQTNRLAELMLAADLAIGAGGSATWERCCLGLPCMAFSIADNQQRLVHDAAMAHVVCAPALAVDAAAWAAHLSSLLDNPLLLSAISRAALQTVDASGVERVLSAMGLSKVSVRQATHADADDIFAWRNHASVRLVSRSNEPIDEATHRRWFESTLADPAKVLLIGEVEGRAMGVVRFDIAGEEAEVSIYRVPADYSRGCGRDLLEAAERWLRTERVRVRHLTAEVLGENRASHRLFAAAGYCASTTEYTKRLS